MPLKGDENEGCHDTRDCLNRVSIHSDCRLIWIPPYCEPEIHCRRPPAGQLALRCSPGGHEHADSESEARGGPNRLGGHAQAPRRTIVPVWGRHVGAHLAVAALTADLDPGLPSARGLVSTGSRPAETEIPATRAGNAGAPRSIDTSSWTPQHRVGPRPQRLRADDRVRPSGVKGVG